VTGAPQVRRAQLDDVRAILTLMSEGALEPDREAGATEDDYRAAFEAIDRDPNQLLLVAESEDGVVATMQLTFIPGLSRRGGWRLQIESVHVAPGLRGRGHGSAMMEHAFEEGRRRGCVLAQLTSNKRRGDAHRFYERLGFKPTHEGMKRPL
jgi:ribosomal protein S18 acetylase RimI-like enzyme